MLNPTDPIALTCAKACELSYEDFDSNVFNQGVVELGFPDFCTIDLAGVQAFCAANAETVIVCFRGTDSGADWLADASASKSYFARCVGRVHTGFLRTLLIVESACREFVADRVSFQPDSRKLIVTGHSLGAAMAVLYAIRSTRLPDAVVSFGCPRVGDAAFAAGFNDQLKEVSLRFVNNNDAVTRIPWKAMGFSHVWRQHYFDAHGKLHADYRPGFWRKLGHAIQGRLANLRRFKIGDGIVDHSIHDYRRLVEKNQRPSV